MRIGHGYDAHRLGDNRRLILGGVDVPHTCGLIAHSDGDVLAHAVIDALFGAAGEKDIGAHFPDSDARYKNVDSLMLLQETASILRNKGFRISYIDATLIAQAPRLGAYLAEMRQNMAAAAGIEADRINVKVTTEEKMGFTGACEGIAAHAVCLLEE